MHSTHNHSKSTTLVRLIGIPGIFEPTMRISEKDIASFLPVAEQNKIHLLFLETVTKNAKNQHIQQKLSHYKEKYKNFLDLTAFTANSLEKVKVRYTLFKTLKPFSCTPSDVDVLLWSNQELETVVTFLTNMGCISLDKSAYGRTMFSPKHKLNIDLTTQVASSGLVYLDKKSLFEHVDTFETHGTTAKSLESAVDLLIVAAHSIFKEQLYTLSDYYTFVMLAQYWKKAAKLSKRFHVEQALNTVLGLTIVTTLTAFGSMDPFRKEFGELRVADVAELVGEDFELPKKLGLTTLAIAFLRKIRDDPASMKSLSYMARFAASPAIYKRIVEHATRRTY